MRYLRFSEYPRFGMTSPVGWSEDQVNQAAKANLAKYNAGQLQITKQLQDSRFAFDPANPAAIYMIDPYWGNGPPAYTRNQANPGEFDYLGPGPIPWPGVGPPPATSVSSSVNASTSLCNCPDGTICPNGDPTQCSSGNSSMYLIGGGILVFAIILLLIKKRKPKAAYPPAYPYPYPPQQPYMQPPQRRKARRKSKK